MCTVVILRRPGQSWPLVLAANRDEMADRPWLPPGRHWPDRDGVRAGRDLLAGGTWLGLSDRGVVAGVLNRSGSLGPAAGTRSRGELPLEALDHADAEAAAGALAHIEPLSYRSFNLVVADACKAYWLRSRAGEDGAPAAIEVAEIPPGLSMITAHDLNDWACPRIAMYLSRFRAAPPPDPGRGDWSAWQELLASRLHDAGAGREGAMSVVTESGFGTLSSSLIALPSHSRPGREPVWLFAAGWPGEAPYRPVAA